MFDIDRNGTRVICDSPECGEYEWISEDVNTHDYQVKNIQEGFLEYLLEVSESNQFHTTSQAQHLCMNCYVGYLDASLEQGVTA